MRIIDPTELYYLAREFKGEIDHIYLHWSAGHYDTKSEHYHINITGDGTIWLTTDDLTELLSHTWPELPCHRCNDLLLLGRHCRLGRGRRLRFRTADGRTDRSDGRRRRRIMRRTRDPDGLSDSHDPLRSG